MRERWKVAEAEVEHLLRALVAAAEDLRAFRTLSPHRFLAVRRARRAIELHRRRRPTKAP
jgi:hypothetical protein